MPSQPIWKIRRRSFLFVCARPAGDNVATAAVSTAPFRKKVRRVMGEEMDLVGFIALGCVNNEPILSARKQNASMPAAADPDVAVTVALPMAADPDGVRMRPNAPASADPNPAAIPAPVA